MLTIHRLQEVLSYDSATGVFRWIKRTGAFGPNRPGVVAGRTASTDCRKRICIDGKLYLSSRLAWFFMTGDWPQGQIDHKDLNKSNDRFDNLRLCTPSQNNANTRMRSHNTSGAKNVQKNGSGWAVRVNGIRGGTYRTVEEAEKAAIELRNRLHGEFARHL